VITEWGNLFVLGGNALLVAGGLYLLSYKIRDRWKSRSK